MEFLSPHSYMKNTSTNGTVLTGHLLNTSKRLWTPKRTRKIPAQLARMKEGKKEKRDQKRNQHLWWEAEGEERFLHSEKPPHGGEMSWDRKGPSGDKRGTQQTVCGRWDKVRTAHRSVPQPCAPQPELCVSCCGGGLGAGK